LNKSLVTALSLTVCLCCSIKASDSPRQDPYYLEYKFRKHWEDGEKKDKASLYREIQQSIVTTQAAKDLLANKVRTLIQGYQQHGGNAAGKAQKFEVLRNTYLEKNEENRRLKEAKNKLLSQQPTAKTLEDLREMFPHRDSYTKRLNFEKALEGKTLFATAESFIPKESWWQRIKNKYSDFIQRVREPEMRAFERGEPVAQRRGLMRFLLPGFVPQATVSERKQSMNRAWMFGH
jgi:hypothetical protein